MDVCRGLDIDISQGSFEMTYMVMEEASEAIEMTTSDLAQAIDYAESKAGKYLVLRADEEQSIVWDTKPGISYKL